MRAKTIHAAAIGAILCAAAGTMPAAYARQANGAAAQSTGYPQVVVNGQPVLFQGQPPIEQNGHLLVPLRGVLEKLGAYVDFDSKTQTVVAFRGQTRISLPIGAAQATVNDRSVSLDVPAQVMNGSTLVPLRFVAESLGAEVNFDYGTNTVNIRLHGGPPPPDVQAMGGMDHPHRDHPDHPFGDHPDGNHPQGDPHRDDPNRAAAMEAARRRGEERRKELDAERARLADRKAVVGIVVSVYTDVQPMEIVLHVPPMPGQPEGTPTITLRPDIKVGVEMPNGDQHPMPLMRIRPGDLISILQDGNDTGIAINLLPPPPRPFH